MGEKEVYDWAGIAKFALFIILSGFKALATSFLLIAWIQVGVLLATNYYEPIAPVKDFVLSYWGYMLAVFVAFDWIVNYRTINKK